MYIIKFGFVKDPPGKAGLFFAQSTWVDSTTFRTGLQYFFSSYPQFDRRTVDNHVLKYVFI